MKRPLQQMNETYVDLKGRSYSLADLDPRERIVMRELMANSSRRDWSAFRNYWISRVDEFYSARGLSRREIQRSLLYRIGQDLGSRLAVASGVARAPDYRDELEQIIRSGFRTRRDFCKATGLSEDMLSHVLSRRKHLAVDTLAAALDRIGYALRVVPVQRRKHRTK